MKEVNPDLAEDPQKLDRRAFLRRAAAVTAGVLLANRFPEATRAQTPEASLSEKELGYIELINPTVVDPMDPSLTTRGLAALESVQLNTEIPQYQEKATLLMFNFSNLMYKNKDLTRSEREAKLSAGEFPGENVSRLFVQELEENPNISIPFVGVDHLFQQIQTKYNPALGLVVHVSDTPGIFTTSDPGLGFQASGFTPWVDERGMHISLFSSDREYSGKPEKRNFLASVDYNFALNNAIEFMVLTGGDQDLWNRFCVSLDGPLRSKKQGATPLLDSIGELAVRPQNGYEGVLDIRLRS